MTVEPPSKTPSEDLTCIDQVLQGRREQFDGLVDRYLPRLWGFFLGIRVPAEHIEDLVQETFLRAYRNLARFDRTRSFATWIMVIGRNLFLDMVRQKRPKEAPLEKESFHVCSKRESPEDESVARVSAAEVLGKLAPEERQLLIWRIYEDLPFADIAERCGEPENTIRTRFHRLMSRLRIVGEKS